jgi:hypothetical protein
MAVKLRSPTMMYYSLVPASVDINIPENIGGNSALAVLWLSKESLARAAHGGCNRRRVSVHHAVPGRRAVSRGPL